MSDKTRSVIKKCFSVKTKKDPLDEEKQKKESIRKSAKVNDQELKKVQWPKITKNLEESNDESKIDQIKKMDKS